VCNGGTCNAYLTSYSIQWWTDWSCRTEWRTIITL